MKGFQNSDISSSPLDNIDTTATMASLVEQVQSLPPELFNKVLDDTFQLEPSSVEIDESYQPPCLLQVDKKSRKAFATSFYGGGVTFEFNSRACLVKWLRSLPKAHIAILRKMKVSFSRCCNEYAKVLSDGTLTGVSIEADIRQRRLEAAMACGTIPYQSILRLKTDFVDEGHHLTS